MTTVLWIFYIALSSGITLQYVQTVGTKKPGSSSDGLLIEFLFSVAVGWFAAWFLLGRIISVRFFQI